MERDGVKCRTMENMCTFIHSCMNVCIGLGTFIQTCIHSYKRAHTQLVLISVYALLAE